MSKLSVRGVRALKEAGFYGDGEGLYLSVKKSGAKSWILRTVVRGKRRDLGVGSVSQVSLAEARERAREMRKVAREGGDPTELLHNGDITLEDAAIAYHSILSSSFRSGKHTRLWLSGLRLHVFPTLGHRRLCDVHVVDVRKVLEPIWVEKHDTARRLKQRLEAIFDWAKGEGRYDGENPVRGIKRVLKPMRRNPCHHAALSWTRVPEFYGELCERDAMSARVLRFIILTAARSGEARCSEWSEIETDMWTVPAGRTKMNSPHRVPLAPEAVKILNSVRRLDDRYVFPSMRTVNGSASTTLSVNAFRPLYARMGREGFTTHGFRSSFRDWCSEHAKVSREVAEAALAHVPGQVERAYQRSDLFDQRRELMNRWSQFILAG